jgi:hypothetical protein
MVIRREPVLDKLRRDKISSEVGIHKSTMNIERGNADDASNGCISRKSGRIEVEMKKNNIAYLQRR